MSSGLTDETDRELEVERRLTANEVTIANFIDEYRRDRKEDIRDRARERQDDEKARQAMVEDIKSTKELLTRGRYFGLGLIGASGVFGWATSQLTKWPFGS